MIQLVLQNSSMCVCACACIFWELCCKWVHLALFTKLCHKTDIYMYTYIYINISIHEPTCITKIHRAFCAQRNAQVARDIFSFFLKFICLCCCLFCKRALWKRRYSAKETYNLIERNAQVARDIFSARFITKLCCRSCKERLRLVGSIKL